MNLNRRVVHIGTAKHSACQLVYAIFDEWYCMLCTYYSELGGNRSLCVLLFSAFVTYMFQFCFILMLIAVEHTCFLCVWNHTSTNHCISLVVEAQLLGLVPRILLHSCMTMKTTRMFFGQVCSIVVLHIISISVQSRRIHG